MRGRIDESHYCKYHREYRHSLEKCVHLADAYQALIDRGAPSIQRFIKKEGNQAGNPRPVGQEARPNNPRTVINTISGNSNRSRKAYARSINADIFSVDARPTKMRRLVPEPITFTDEDGEGLIYPHSDPIIITALIADCEVARVLVDGGSAVNIISAVAFAKLGVEPGMLTRGTASLTAYGGAKIQPIGHMPLTLSLGTWPNVGTCTTLFVISDCPSAYNVILGRPTLGDLMARVSYYHLTLKFPTSSGIGKVRGDQALA
ncbi:uncharacterized protein LOC112171089 [Rosa chinensis]|uniref:uncharacterized protein LOC112171089 n=1 Tax=Rosa chinensis TaxID=74649 RepID=UPI000D0937EF|nr:uncharacterized protein LOC112171089 [Rosa chinensis]